MTTGQAEPAKGVNGQLAFDGSMVLISRKGFMARTTVGKGDKRIPVRSITAVQWKPAGITSGFIQFTVAGGIERRSQFGRQLRDATRDENSVTFTRRQQSHFERLRAEIEAAINGPQYAPAPTASAPPPQPAVPPGAPPAQWNGHVWQAWNAAANRWMIWDGQAWR